MLPTDTKGVFGSAYSNVLMTYLLPGEVISYFESVWLIRSFFKKQNFLTSWKS